MAIIPEAEGPYWDHLRERLVEMLSDTQPPNSQRLIPMPRKPILCLDFDGVLHSYTSGWQGADVIPDPPVPGALRFLAEAVEHFEVHVFSSRSGQPGGIVAMMQWLDLWVEEELGASRFPYYPVRFPTEKPPAMLTIDDRALTFTGQWPSIESLLAFKPWYQRYDAGMTSPEARQLNEALCSVLNIKPIHDILIEVASERRRQIVEKGFSSAHDDQHGDRELSKAACWLIDDASEVLYEGLIWPWPESAPRQRHAPRQSLIQACALLVAEIERLDRLDVRTTEQRG